MLYTETMKAVIFATLIVLKLIISSASALAEPEDIVTALEKQAALDNEDAEENSGMNNCKKSIKIVIISFDVGMTVHFAYYGLNCAAYEYGLNNHAQHSSTNWAKSLCDGKNSCHGTVSYYVISDQYYECNKDFLVIAECPNGHIITSYVPMSADWKTFSLRC